MPYQAFPLNLEVNKQNDRKFTKLLDRLSKYESVFTEFKKGEETKTLVARNITNPQDRAWEVWQEEQGEILDFAGILRLSRILSGCDAIADYFFLDGRLRDKTELLKSWMEWSFQDHPGWTRLQRLTLELPANAFAMIRHAERNLGFSKEGLKKEGGKVNGKALDVVILGKINGSQGT